MNGVKTWPADVSIFSPPFSLPSRLSSWEVKALSSSSSSSSLSISLSLSLINISSHFPSRLLPPLTCAPLDSADARVSGSSSERRFRPEISVFFYCSERLFVSESRSERELLRGELWWRALTWAIWWSGASSVISGDFLSYHGCWSIFNCVCVCVSLNFHLFPFALFSWSTKIISIFAEIMETI